MAHEFNTGTVIARRYQVRRELGRGGMGVVYLCRDLMLDERVAVKILKTAETDTSTEEVWWFREEARALASLSHPAIVRALDFGTLSDGTPYLVMDAVAGRSLHEWIYLAQTQGLMPWPIVWTITDQVLGALAHAHARGVIHGDLKPSNIIVDLSDDDKPQVHVLDLGLAWVIQDRVDHRLDGTHQTEPVVRWGAGTPGWMAPEQIRFATPHVGPPTDLYALGCILYALLTNQEPYTGTNDELLQQHRNATVPTPKLSAEVPGEVAEFVRRLLAKRPWQRFDFAGDARRIWQEFRPVSDSGRTPFSIPGASLFPRPSSGRDLVSPEAIDNTSEPTTCTTGLLGLRPSPLVARTVERTRLLELVDEVLDSPEPIHRFIIITGEAGVGKSRLAEWLCEQVHEQALAIPLRAKYRKIAAPLDGVIGAVTQHYRLEKAQRDVVERVLMNLWNVAPEDDLGTTWVAAAAEWIRPSTPNTDFVGPSGKRFSFDRPELKWGTVRRTLERVGADKPILLWLDDVHFASETTFEGLKRVHLEAPGLRLLVVATARSEALDVDPESAARVESIVREFRMETMVLPPLNPAQTHALLRDTLPLDESAAEEAAARSKGNPLFALQLLHAWAGGGHLEMREGRYHVPRASLSVRAKTTAELWEERLRALPEGYRSGALAAAALGGDIREDVLRVQLRALDLPAERVIGSMKRSQILLASSGERLRWPHALLQEHLLSELVLQDNAAAVFRAAADALGFHPSSASRRVVRHRVLNLVRAGAPNEAAELLHGAIVYQWGRSRDAAATLRELALLDGKLDGVALGCQMRWRAEALRHAGRLEEARTEAFSARQIFKNAHQLDHEGHCLRLLGHIASDLAEPATGRSLVAEGLKIFVLLENEHGQAQCEVTLGEIDYLLGDHLRARATLAVASDRFQRIGDRLGRAQCLMLQAFVEQAGGALRAARELLKTARSDLDALGYRLGIAQCDCALGHVDHRDNKFKDARAVALAARQNFRDLSNPRGEAACERLLAMAALDVDDTDVAMQHAKDAADLFEKLSDPWGMLEASLLLAQGALCRGKLSEAKARIKGCEKFTLIEAEPKQHKCLTLAWLSVAEGRTQDAVQHMESAREAFKDPARTGDHTLQLLERFAKLSWPKPVHQRVEQWRRILGKASSTHPDRAAEQSKNAPSE